MHIGLLLRKAEVGQRRLHLLGEQVEGAWSSMVRVVIEQEELVGMGRSTLVYRKMGRMLMQSTVGEVNEELGKEKGDLKARLRGLGERRKGARRELRGVERELGEVEVREVSPSLVVAVSRLLERRPSLGRRGVWVGRATPTTPMLQEGPQCGLVALAMAAAAMGEECEVEHLVTLAREQGFTMRGEMFSVADMAELARQVLPNFEVKVEKGGRMAETQWLVDGLLAGSLLLVPYDCSADHSPGLWGGQKAHWCLVTGFLLPTSSPPPSSPLPGCPGFHLLPPGPSPGLHHRLLPSEELMVVARQGKSVLPCLWSRSALVASCGNLRQAAATRMDGSYVLPEGGGLQGLQGKIVLISRQGFKTNGS